MTRRDDHDEEGCVDQAQCDEVEPVAEPVVDAVEEPADGDRLSAEDDGADEEHQALGFEFADRQSLGGISDHHREPKSKVEKPPQDVADGARGRPARGTLRRNSLVCAVRFDIVHAMDDTRRELYRSTSQAQAVSIALTTSRQLHSATEELLDAAAERYGINRNDLRCLEILEREGPTQPAKLAEASGLSRAAITKVLDRLERAGYITRSGDRDDRRTHQVRTSAHQARQRHEIWEPVLAAARAALNDHDVAELQMLAAALSRLADANRESAGSLRRR